MMNNYAKMSDVVGCGHDRALRAEARWVDRYRMLLRVILCFQLPGSLQPSDGEELTACDYVHALQKNPKGPMYSVYVTVLYWITGSASDRGTLSETA